MIFDTINKASFYFALSPNLRKGLEFLLNSENYKNLPLGKTIIDGDNVFVLVQEYDTKPFNEDMWEAHKKYFDIQFIIEGYEEIKVSRIENMTPNTPYHVEGDYWLFTGNGQGIHIAPNQFIILSPEDVHQPCIQINNTIRKVKKIVVKAMI